MPQLSRSSFIYTSPRSYFSRFKQTLVTHSACEIINADSTRLPSAMGCIAREVAPARNGKTPRLSIACTVSHATAASLALTKSLPTEVKTAPFTQALACVRRHCGLRLELHHPGPASRRQCVCRNDKGSSNASAGWPSARVLPSLFRNDRRRFRIFPASSSKFLLQDLRGRKRTALK